MKNITLAIFVFFGLSSFAQNFEYNFNFDMVLYTLNEFSVPENLEGSVQTMTVNTKNKKSEYKSENKFNAQGKVIERKISGKHTSLFKADYTEDGKTKFYSQTRDGKAQYEKLNIYDDQGRLIESIEKNSKGAISQRNIWVFKGDQKCPESSARFVKGGKKLKRSWQYNYFSACDKSKTELKNAKGKTIRTWTYDCKKEGEILLKKKDETQVCRWDESDGKFLVKIDQNFDEKGRIRKTVSKYNIADTSIVEVKRYDGSDQLIYKWVYLGSYDKMVSSENFKNGKVIYGHYNEYLGQNKVKSEYIIKGKRKSLKTYEYNDKGLLVKLVSLGKKGRTLSVSVYEYELNF